MTEFIPVNEPLLNGNEKKYLLECIESGWISSEGPFVARFENAMASALGRKHAVCVSSGTAALDVAVAALDIGPGDEVILPSFTIISCALAIIRAGAVPVVVDSDPLSWNMDVSRIEEKITARTRAILAVHIYGLPLEMDAVIALAEKHELLVIEDAAQMLGQTINGKACGSFGELSTLSFYPNKHVTTGEGGMVLTDSDELAEKCKQFRDLCFNPKNRFVHEGMGWNYRMSNLQAAVGLAQLEQLPDFIMRKRNTGNVYNKLLANLPHVQLPLSQTEFASNVYWVYGIVLLPDAGINAAQMIAKLAENGIGSRPFFWPMHQQPVLTRKGFFDDEHCPVAENLATQGFYIPSGLALTENQQNRVAKILHEVLS